MPKALGFALMTEERRREIAALGGRSVPADKRSFSQDRVLAREAGGKGGRTVSRKRTGQLDAFEG